MRKLNDYEKGFIEAFIDTDGSITIGKPRRKEIIPHISVRFSNNSKEILEKVMKILGIRKNLQTHSKKKRHCYTLLLSRRESVALLKQIKLVVKEDRRKAILELYEYVDECREKGCYSTGVVPIDYRERVNSIIGPTIGE